MVALQEDIHIEERMESSSYGNVEVVRVDKPAEKGRLRGVTVLSTTVVLASTNLEVNVSVVHLASTSQLLTKEPVVAVSALQEGLEEAVGRRACPVPVLPVQVDSITETREVLRLRLASLVVPGSTLLLPAVVAPDVTAVRFRVTAEALHAVAAPEGQ
eukprot:gb/GECG01015571.1/.p1 GENE.gb/GECG01015571.1/~~gb/GECG01015571.1/.p1  ORF type:complete len:158 (+),score=23.34 gb/GECG01015571.1/:1-474(+)